MLLTSRCAVATRFLSLWLILISTVLGQSASDVTVDLGYATYVGNSTNGTNKFLGMRYAAAPVGDLRWRAPAPPPNSTAAQQAKDVCGGFPGSGAGQGYLVHAIY